MKFCETIESNVTTLKFDLDLGYLKSLPNLSLEHEKTYHN